MSELAKYRTLMALTLKDVARRLTGTEPKMTSPLLCLIENGAANPTPKELDALSVLYGVDKEDLISYEEVDYGLRPSKNALRLRESRRRKKLKNFCVMLEAERLEHFEENLRICDYNDKKAWLKLQLKKLDVEAGKITAAREKAKTKAKEITTQCPKVS